MLLMMLLWFVMTLFCCAVVSFRFAMSAVTSLKLVFLLSRSGETETLAAGNGVVRPASVVARLLSQFLAAVGPQ